MVKKKGFFARIMDKLDSKLEKESKNKKCCCKSKKDTKCKE